MVAPERAAWLKTQVAPPSIAACRAFAQKTLSEPPAKPHIERAKPRGTLLATFVVQPLTLMPPVNKLKRMKGWQISKEIEAVAGYMRPQLRAMTMNGVLRGRPMVRAVRFSFVEPDHDNAWTKLPIDRLVDFGVLKDDRPALLNLKPWWEPAPRGQGFGYFEIWSGDQC